MKWQIKLGYPRAPIFQNTDILAGQAQDRFFRGGGVEEKRDITHTKLREERGLTDGRSLYQQSKQIYFFSGILLIFLAFFVLSCWRSEIDSHTGACFSRCETYGVISINEQRQGYLGGEEIHMYSVWRKKKKNSPQLQNQAVATAQSH